MTNNKTPSAEEVADARAAQRFYPDAETVHRSQTGTVLLADAEDMFAGRLPANLFPSIRPGQSVTLSDIVGGEA